MLLCLLLGPIGLAYISLQYAITATLITLLALLALVAHAPWIWLCAVFLSTLTALLLIRSKYKQASIDKFELSTYIGTVSCRITKSRSNNRSYRRVLKRLKFRRRLRRGINSLLGVTCVLLACAIAAPDLVPEFFKRKTSTDQPLITAKNTDEAYQTAPLLRLDQEQGDYSVRSSNMIQGQSGPYRAVLTISCHKNKTALSLESTDILRTERSTMIIDVNGDRTQQSNWSIDHDYHRASAPAPISTLKRMQDQAAVVIQYHTYGSADSRVARFDGQFIDVAVKHARRDCHW